MSAHDHQDQHHDEASELSETELRVRAPQSILVEKGLCRARRAGRDRRDLCDQGRPAYRRPRDAEHLARANVVLLAVGV